MSELKYKGIIKKDNGIRLQEMIYQGAFQSEQKNLEVAESGICYSVFPLNQ